MKPCTRATFSSILSLKTKKCSKLNERWRIRNYVNETTGKKLSPCLHSIQCCISPSHGELCASIIGEQSLRMSEDTRERFASCVCHHGEGGRLISLERNSIASGVTVSPSTWYHHCQCGTVEYSLSLSLSFSLFLSRKAERLRAVGKCIEAARIAPRAAGCCGKEKRYRRAHDRCLSYHRRSSKLFVASQRIGIASFARNIILNC